MVVGCWLVGWSAFYRRAEDVEAGSYRAPHLQQQSPPLRTVCLPLFEATHSPTFSEISLAVIGCDCVVFVVMFLWCWLVNHSAFLRRACDLTLLHSFATIIADCYG